MVQARLLWLALLGLALEQLFMSSRRSASRFVTCLRPGLEI